MTYFTSASSGKRYIALFFSKSGNASCSGTLFALSRFGIVFTALLPGLATIIAIASMAEISSWIGFLFLPSRLAKEVSYYVNWGQIFVSLIVAVVTAIIVSHSQFHAVRNRDFFSGPSNSIFQIDWHRSISMFVVNVLFAINGILFTLWVNYSPEQGDEYGRLNNLGLVLSMFALTLLPGAFRLAWLWKLRKEKRIHWS